MSETDHRMLSPVLSELLTINDSRALEALVLSFQLYPFDPPLTSKQQATLTNAILSAAARCWPRQRDCCGD